MVSARVAAAALLLAAAAAGGQAAAAAPREVFLGGVRDAVGVIVQQRRGIAAGDAAATVTAARAGGEVLQARVNATESGAAANATEDAAVVCPSVAGMQRLTGFAALDAAGNDYDDDDALVVATDGDRVLMVNLSRCASENLVPVLSASQALRVGFSNGTLGPMAQIGRDTLAVSSLEALADEVAGAISRARRVALVNLANASMVGLLRVDLQSDGPWGLFASPIDNSLGVLEIDRQANGSDVLVASLVDASPTSNAVIPASMLEASLATQEKLSAAFAELPAPSALEGTQFDQSLALSGPYAGASAVIGGGYFVNFTADASTLVAALRHDQGTFVLISDASGSSSAPTPERNASSAPTSSIGTPKPTRAPSPSPTVASPVTASPTPGRAPTTRPTSAPSAAPSGEGTEAPSGALPARLGQNMYGIVVVVSSLTCCCGVGLVFLRRFQRGGRPHHGHRDDHLGDFEMIDEPMFDSFLEGQQRSRVNSYANEEVAVI